MKIGRSRIHVVPELCIDDVTEEDMMHTVLFHGGIGHGGEAGVVVMERGTGVCLGATRMMIGNSGTELDDQESRRMARIRFGIGRVRAH